MSKLRSQINEIVYIITKLFRCMKTEPHDFLEGSNGGISLAPIEDADVDHQNEIIDFQHHLSSILLNYFNDRQIDILADQLMNGEIEEKTMNRLLDRADFNTRSCFIYEDIFICAMSILMAICGQIILDNSTLREDTESQSETKENNTIKFPTIYTNEESNPKEI